MDKKNIDLSIVIVNWNSKEYIYSCLKSIYKNTSGLKYEIIVVDNASFDGCDSMIKKYFPKVTYIQSEKNSGFARANNLGFKNSTGKVILFLNPDTELVNPAINILYAEILKKTDAGIVGAKLLNDDNSLQTSCIQPYPTILNQIFDIEFFKTKFPKIKIWGMRPLYTNDDKPAKVEVVSGACLMIERNLFKQVGYFSTDYFMYTEDIDLCFKVGQTSQNIYFIPEAEIKHYGGGSSEKEKASAFSTIMMRESIFRFLQKTKGSQYAFLYRVSMSFIAPIRILIILFFVFLKNVKSTNSNINYSLKKWFKILRWSLGLEKALIQKYEKEL